MGWRRCAVRRLAARWGHRALPQRDRAMSPNGNGARVGGAIGTSRPTATGHGNGARVGNGSGWGGGRRAQFVK